MPTGTVRRVEPARGFGFLKDDYGNDWFFVREGIAEPELSPGDRVAFEEESTPLGPRATRIRRVDR